MHGQAPPLARRRQRRLWWTDRPRAGFEGFQDDVELGGGVLPDRATIQVLRRARHEARIVPPHRNRISLAWLVTHWSERLSPASVLPVCLPLNAMIDVFHH